MIKLDYKKYKFLIYYLSKNCFSLILFDMIIYIYIYIYNHLKNCFENNYKKNNSNDLYIYIYIN